MTPAAYTKYTGSKTNWKHNATNQTVAGIKYIKARYGDSCQALTHLNNNGWF